MKSDQATYTGFQFEVDGHPALAIINSDLKNFEGKELYTHSVFIELEPDSYDADGHPDADEHDYLVEIEKQVIAYLESESRTVHVGHTTLYRKREILFYTADPEVVGGYLDYFLPTTERAFHFDIEEDPGWESVSAFYELI